MRFNLKYRKCCGNDNIWFEGFEAELREGKYNKVVLEGEVYVSRKEILGE